MNQLDCHNMRKPFVCKIIPSGVIDKLHVKIAQLIKVEQRLPNVL